ncbi:hypothetical protein RJT34_03979 [Clitoria ternatea]|uniref:Uncharacterized protein n=1 Tax=Clitoria ternatea TaxID=43366 RepID=A0AAN9KKE9_CLITE
MQSHPLFLFFDPSRGLVALWSPTVVDLLSAMPPHRYAYHSFPFNMVLIWKCDALFSSAFNSFASCVE